MGPTHNIFLNPKDLAQTSTAIGWKKIVEINILFGYEFDINAKIRLDN